MKFLLRFVLCVAVVAQLTTAADKAYSMLGEMLYLNKVMLPADKFNAQCVANDCPELKGLCPKVNDKDSLVKVLNTANGCMTKSVCGLVQDPNPIPTSTFDSSMWPVYHETKTCTVDKGGEISHSSHAQVVGVTQALSITRVHQSMPDITSIGDLTCGDNQATIHYDHLITFNCTIAITQDPFTLTVVDPEWIYLSIATNITTATGTVTKNIPQFNPILLKLAEWALQVGYASFLTKYYRDAFEVAMQNCTQ